MGRLRITLAFLVLVAAVSAAASGRWPWRRLQLAAKRGAELPPAAPEPAAPTLVENADTLRRGETVGALFARQGVVGLDLRRLGAAVDLNPRRLRPGLIFKFLRPHADSAPTTIRVRTTPERMVVFSWADSGWAAAAETIPWRTELVRAEGAIDQSLYLALDAQISDDYLGAGERARLAWDLADVFAWQIDFTRDIRPGDRFRVLFDRLVSPDGEVRFGRILAGDLTVGGKRYTAFRFDDGVRSTFYDAGGNSLRRAFLRAPVQFRRMSSGFARARYHPVLGIWRRHEGTDYAAASGTPVMAAGDGVVVSARVRGGYGKMVEVRHRNGITTRYAHLSGFARGIRAGVRVTQGQVIGYVGATGLASGPHLHYEFRVNGVARDSRRIALGNGEPVPAAKRAAFMQERDRLTALLEQAQGISEPVLTAASAQ